MTQSILVPASVIDSVSKRLGKIAAKCGVAVDRVAGTTVVYRKTVQLRERPESAGGGTYKVVAVDTTQALECVRVTIGDMPRFNGHTFVGKISHIKLADGTTGNTLSLAPAEREAEIPADWRECKPTCDHCNTTRPRKDTFLIRQPDGKLVRVGRNCLADFLMCDPSAMIDLSLFQDEIRSLCDGESDGEEGFGGGWGSYAPTTLHYLACCVTATDKVGFVSRDAHNIDGRPMTRDYANWLASSFRKRSDRTEREDREEWLSLQPTLDTMATVVGILCWLESAETTDFIHNLRIAVQTACAEPRVMGLLAACPQSYGKAMGAIAARKVREARPNAGYLGQPKQRLDFVAELTRVFAVDSDFGTKHMIGFRTLEGHECIWWCSGDNHPGASEVGQKFTVRGTVKKHAEYTPKGAEKAIQQTEFSRCIFTPIVESD